LLYLQPVKESMKRREIEIMAPAGSYESLIAARQGGADSVYFGVENLNMRAASSNNFTLKDLRRIASFCRKHGLRSYLTLNVVVFDEEMPEPVGALVEVRHRQIRRNGAPIRGPAPPNRSV